MHTQSLIQNLQKKIMAVMLFCCLVVAMAMTFTACTNEPVTGTSAAALTDKEAKADILATLDGEDLGPATVSFQGWNRVSGDVYEADILNQTPAAKMRCRAGSERYVWENSGGILCERLYMYCCRTCTHYPGGPPGQCCGDTALECYVDRIHGY